MATKYRGKYPTRISEIYQVRNDGTRRLVCNTNDGKSFFVEPIAPHCPMPLIGDIITTYQESRVYRVKPRVRI